MISSPSLRASTRVKTGPPLTGVPVKGGIGKLFYTFLLSSLLWVHAPASALEMSSKKDCAICHIMWIDDFRTQKETLIPWQPGNVLMKDTMGVVSTEEMCYSCHDGYVLDDRSTAWKYNNHKTFVKPSESVAIPPTLPLSVRDEIYCGTCHTAHGPGPTVEGKITGASFMRETTIVAGICGVCHSREAAFQKTNGHPMVPLESLPQTLMEAGALVAAKENRILCQTCHKVHGAKGDKIVVVENRNSQLCVLCHGEQKNLVGTPHDLRRSLPESRNVRERKPAESGPCGACHTPHNAVGKKLWARSLGSGNPAARMCLSCHGEGSGLDVTGIGKISHPIQAKPVAPVSAGGLPLYLSDGSPSPEGEIQCFTCHDAHRWSPLDPALKGGKKGSGDGSNSFLRMANGGDSDLCVACHVEKKPVLATDHNLRVTAPSMKNRQGFDATASGTCGACHVPHNAAGNRLYARTMKPGNFASQACLTCHGTETSTGVKPVGAISHPLEVKPAPGASPAHLPLFSGEGARIPQGAMQCLTCHDAHRWSPAAAAGSPGKNLEGTGTTSFLRVENAASKLCRACHWDQQPVASSDHNLAVTAPTEKNLLGDTVAASGPCGACHIPHNASGRNLWARPQKEKDPAGNTCAGCHRPEGAAGKKLVGTYSHPVGVEVSGKKGDGTLPLYGQGGTRQGGNRMMCLTCHNPHRWDPRGALPQDLPENREGDAATSFLRTANFPSPELCKACHPEQAPVTGTPHDLNRSAPRAVNALGQTAASSGVCGACHLVHNSPNPERLWARPYGPVPENGNVLNGLCTGCHSRGGPGEKTAPVIASHPQGKLMNNVMVSEAGNTGYTMLWNGDGQPTRVGELACPSCHDAHHWSPLPQPGEERKDLKTIDGYRFLRAMSYNTICMDCHGPDGFYRYMHFHDPKKRKSP